MNQFDCKIAVPKLCKADCCGIVQIPKFTFEVMNDEIITNPYDVVEIDNETFPLTRTSKCCFLTKSYKCNIYNYRPEVCRDFGLIEQLPCPYIDNKGQLRSKEDIKKWKISNAEEVNRRIERIKKYAGSIDNVIKLE